jgi:hypothetical protein
MTVDSSYSFEKETGGHCAFLHLPSGVCSITTLLKLSMVTEPIRNDMRETNISGICIDWAPASYE